MKIKVEDIMRGIALIENATQSPLVRAAITRLLPDFGLTPEDLAKLDENHGDYEKWLTELRSRDADPPTGAPV